MTNNARGVTFVIPALNEEDIISETVADVYRVVSDHLQDFEIILVDDGSTDRTGALMEDLARHLDRVRVIHNPRNLGLGESYKRGLAAARHRYLMMLCGDGGFPATSLPPVLAALGRADIVIPRISNLKEIKTPFRYFTSRTYTTLLNLLFGLRIGYYNGLPLHRVDLLRRIDITSDSFGFQAEILIKLIRAGCRYVEVDVPGAERTQRSNALRLRNLVSVAGTLASLIAELVTYKAPVIADTYEAPAVDVTPPAPQSPRSS